MQCNLNSDFLQLWITGGDALLGMHSDLDLAVSSGLESVKLARELQMVDFLRDMSYFLSCSAFNAGAFRICWKNVNDYYHVSMEEKSYFQLGRSTALRVALLCVLNNPAKGLACIDDVLAVESGIMKSLGWEDGLGHVRALSFFRSGREEEANASIEAGRALVRNYRSGPWFTPPTHSYLCVIREMHTKAVTLRKKSKIKRLVETLGEGLASLEAQKKNASCLGPHVLYWRGIYHRMREEDDRAQSYFDLCVTLSESEGAGDGSIAYAACLAHLEMAQMQGTLEQKEQGAALLRRFTLAGDLHTLSLLNDSHVEGASDAYNLLLNEREYETVFSADITSDEMSSAAGSGFSSQAASSALHVMDFNGSEDGMVGGKGDSGGENDLEQDLDENVFTGREQEIEVFRARLKALCVSDSHGSASNTRPLAIVGPSGMGKTALLDEFALLCPYGETAVLRASCRAAERQTTFFAFREIFSTLLRVRLSTPIQDRTNALIRAIEDNSFYRTIPHRALLKSVLAVNLIDTNATKKMVGKTKADATSNVLFRFLVAKSFVQPVVIIVDDIQWLDRDSFQLLAKLCTASSIMVVVSTRRDGPEDHFYSDFMNKAKR